MSFSSTLLALLDTNSAYWKFGDASGSTTANDDSGNGRSGTVTGSGWAFGATGLLAGDPDTAGSSGGAGWIDVANGAWMARSTASMGCWFATTASAQRMVMGRFTSGTNNDYLFIDLNSATQVRAYAIIAGTQRTLTGTVTNCKDGNRHFIVATYDGTTFTLYYDGSSVASLTTSGSLPTTAANDFLIGKRGDTGTGVFSGTLEKAWFGPPLTSTQVASLYTAGTTSGAITGATSPTEATSATIGGRVEARGAAALTESTSTTVAAHLGKLGAVSETEATSVTVTAGQTFAAAAALTETSSLVASAAVSRAAAVSITELSSLAVAASLEQMAAVTITEDTSVAVSTLSELAVAIIEATSVGWAAVVVNIGPVDDNLTNGGALMMTGWSTVNWIVDPPGGDRADLPAVHVEPV